MHVPTPPHPIPNVCCAERRVLAKSGGQHTDNGEERGKSEPHKERGHDDPIDRQCLLCRTDSVNIYSTRPNPRWATCPIVPLPHKQFVAWPEACAVKTKGEKDIRELQTRYPQTSGAEGMRRSSGRPRERQRMMKTTAEKRLEMTEAVADS